MSRDVLQVSGLGRDLLLYRAEEPVTRLQKSGNGASAHSTHIIVTVWTGMVSTVRPVYYKGPQGKQNHTGQRDIDMPNFIISLRDCQMWISG